MNNTRHSRSSRGSTPRIEPRHTQSHTAVVLEQALMDNSYLDAGVEADIYDNQRQQIISVSLREEKSTHVIPRRSLSEKQHLEMFGRPSLLKHGTPNDVSRKIGRRTSRSGSFSQGAEFLPEQTTSRKHFVGKTFETGKPYNYTPAEIVEENNLRKK